MLNKAIKWQGEMHNSEMNGNMLSPSNCILGRAMNAKVVVHETDSGDSCSHAEVRVKTACNYFKMKPKR